MPKQKTSNYRLCWKYLKEAKIYFIIILALFIVSVIFGAFWHPQFLADYIKNIIEQLTEQTKGMDFFQLLVFIFKNNILTSASAMILGFFLGIYPAVIALLNGYVLGFVAGKTAAVQGFASLFRLLPHGIFEIPAFVISLGLGLRLGMVIFSKNIGKQLKYCLINSIRIFIYIVLPLLLIAAVIETSLIFILG